MPYRRSYKKTMRRRTYKKSSRRRYTKRSRLSYKRSYRGRKSAPTLKKKVSRLGKRVTKVARVLKNTIGIKKFREVFSQSMAIVASNNVEWDSIKLCNVLGLERALAGLNYFNPLAPATLIVANGTTAEYAQRYDMSGHFTATLRNNYQIDLEVWTWMCVPKEQTFQEPHEAVITGLEDAGITDANSILTYPSDSNVFMKTWRVVPGGTKHVFLKGGSSFECSYGTKWTYDPSVDDQFNEVYYPQFGSVALMVKIRGTLVHDPSSSTTVGLSLGQLDILTEHQYVIKYDAGYSARYLVIDNNLDSVTASGVQTLKPTSNNQIFNTL